METKVTKNEKIDMTRGSPNSWNALILSSERDKYLKKINSKNKRGVKKSGLSGIFKVKTLDAINKINNAKKNRGNIREGGRKKDIDIGEVIANKKYINETNFNFIFCQNNGTTRKHEKYKTDLLSFRN